MTEHETLLLGYWLAGDIEPSLGTWQPGEPMGRLAYNAQYMLLGGTDDYRYIATGQPYWVLKGEKYEWRSLCRLRHVVWWCSASTLIDTSVLHTFRRLPELYPEFYCEYCQQWAYANEFTLAL